ncbi:MAG: hypothetical protein LBF12_03580 [Christensenellaceae bacterium]|jgi:hypothetical protein|nr:hypothetical protein [Christensenellaceae bacterium]
MALSKKEKNLMNVIYGIATQNAGQCLVTPLEILAKIPYKVKFSELDLQPILDALSYDGYFEYELTSKKSEPVYLITLKEKGNAYEREKKHDRRKIYTRIIMTIICALLSWAVKMIIDAIIK